MSNKQLPATKLTDTSTSAEEELGRVRWENGKAYRYILVEDAALANGDVVEYSDTTGYEVTNDRAGGSSIGRGAAGVAIGTIADGSYGWIQISGVHTAVKTDGGVAAGDYLVAHTVDGQSDTMADGEEEQVFALALATDSGTTSAGTVSAAIRGIL